MALYVTRWHYMALGGTIWHSVDNSLDKRYYGPVAGVPNGRNTIYGRFTKEQYKRTWGKLYLHFKLSFYFHEYVVLICGFAD